VLVSPAQIQANGRGVITPRFKTASPVNSNRLPPMIPVGLWAVAFHERKLSMQHILEIPAGTLKNAFAGLSKIVSGRTTLPVLACVRIEADANGSARFQVTDLDSFATCELPATSPTGFPPCLIPFEPLNRIIKGTKNSLRLLNEKDKVNVQSMVGTATVAQSLATVPLAEWPVAPAPIKPTFCGNATFKKSLREALECSSTDSSRYVINGACLDLSQPGCHCIIGTDGRHLYSANTFRFELPKSVIVPARKFLAWPGFSADGDWRVALLPDQNQQSLWVQLQSDHWTFITKPIDGIYPNWRQVVPAENRKVTRVTLNDEAIQLMLDALPRLPGGDDNYQPVTLSTVGGQFRLSAKAKDDTQPSEIPIASAELSGADAQIRLDRNFVIKALRFGFATFEWTDELSPILFTGPGRKMVVMPLSPETAASPKSKSQSTEASGPAIPSADQPQSNPTENKKTMSQESIPTPPRRGNLRPLTEGNNQPANGSALNATVTQIENVRTGLRDVIADLATTLDLLRAAEKEKKASAKEVESVRSTLRSLQKVAI
jgi:DNA polymerase III sliding clamp (beta) subunit (PCNA family)